MSDLLFFLSDFGTDDEFVGVVHAVLARRAPRARVVDISHGVPPHDIRAGALMLWRAAPWLAGGVILAVVDPGVGTDRRAVAVETAGPEPTVLVGPDNALLLPAATRLGGIRRAIELVPAGAPPAGATFAGRDLFAPAAAAVASGTDLADLGRAIEPGTLVGRSVPDARRDPATGEVVAEVLWVDRYGNAQLNVDASTAAPGSRWRVRHPGGPPAAAVLETVTSYGGIPAGDPGLALVIDSYGMLSICAYGRSAALLVGLGPGDEVRLGPP